MKFGLSEKTIREIGGVFERYPQIKSAIIYGSRAKGNFRPGSDIDLTLCVDADLARLNLFKMQEELDDLAIPYSIDLSILSEISDPGVLDHIRRVGLTFWNRTETKSPAP